MFLLTVSQFKSNLPDIFKRKQNKSYTEILLTAYFDSAALFSMVVNFGKTTNWIKG